MLDIVDWAESEKGFYLMDGPLAGKPIPLVDHHQRILRYLFTPRSDGRFPHNVIVWGDIKKSTKTTTAAMVHQFFAQEVDVPPTDREGRPLAEQPPAQFVLSNDRKAARDRVFRYLAGSVETNPYLRGRCVINEAEIVFPWGTRVQALPVDYRGEAGSNFVLATVDEPWGIMYKQGRRMMTEFQPVPTRLNSILFFTGYAGWEGESEFWADLYNKGLRGQPVPGLEDLPCYADGSLFMYWNTTPNLLLMPWHTDGFLEASAKNMHPNEFARVYQNKWVPSVDTFVDIRYWDACQDEDLKPVGPDEAGVPMVIGLDASETGDCTAASCRGYDPATNTLPLLMHRIWWPKPNELVEGRSVVDLRAVEQWVLHMHRKHRVAAVYYDPFQLHAISLNLAQEGIKMVRVTQGLQRVEADEQWYNLIHNSQLRNYYAPDARDQVNHAVARQSSAGFRLDKRATTKKIDFAVADSMACYGVIENKTLLAAMGRKRPVLVAAPPRQAMYDRIYHRSRW